MGRGGVCPLHDAFYFPPWHTTRVREVIVHMDHSIPRHEIPHVVGLKSDQQTLELPHCGCNVRLWRSRGRTSAVVFLFYMHCVPCMVGMKRWDFATNNKCFFLHLLSGVQTFTVYADLRRKDSALNSHIVVFEKTWRLCRWQQKTLPANKSWCSIVSILSAFPPRWNEKKFTDKAAEWRNHANVPSASGIIMTNQSLGSYII